MSEVLFNKLNPNKGEMKEDSESNVTEDDYDE